MPPNTSNSTAARSLLNLRTPNQARQLATSTISTEPKVSQQTTAPPWRSAKVLDEWVARDARPTSLRQLTVFGRNLNEKRILDSANYVREELPIRIAHRLRNMQTLPYSALTNHHIRHVYELYYDAFERFRKVGEVRSLDDNDRFCEIINHTLREHLSVIPRLVSGVLEIQRSVGAEQCDRFMTTLLRSRISRRVIAQQHLALSETLRASSRRPKHPAALDDFIGEVFLRCNAREIIGRCAANTRELIRHAYGAHVAVPDVVLHGHPDTTFPYIPSHLEYIVGELLRNSVQAAVERRADSSDTSPPPPIDVLVCGAAEHVIIRFSDRGGGIDRDVLPHLWSFAKGPRRSSRLRNLEKVPRLAATREDVQAPGLDRAEQKEEEEGAGTALGKFASSLTSLSGRPPGLRLGIGLPISKLYAEYWAGSLEIHSLEGYGCDAFLQISRLGNRNEVLSTRASMDAV